MLVKHDSSFPLESPGGGYCNDTSSTKIAGLNFGSAKDGKAFTFFALMRTNRIDCSGKFTMIIPLAVGFFSFNGTLETLASFTILFLSFPPQTSTYSGAMTPFSDSSKKLNVT